jgi:hypothetical protein
MAIYRSPPIPTATQRRFTSQDWRTLVESVDPRPPTEVSYEFSNGRKFEELFVPTGGAYE